jgi:hypothetical protein
MPASSLIPKNGAITYGSYSCDFASFDIEVSQAVDNVTPYGTNTCTKNVGNGTPDFVFNVGAFALAHATSTPPNYVGATTSGFAPGFNASGGAMTLTLDTGVSVGCMGILQRHRISHARMRGYVPIAMTLHNGAEITETWATS